MNNKLKRELPKLNENHTPKGMLDQTRWYNIRKAAHRQLIFDTVISKKENLSLSASAATKLTLDGSLTQQTYQRKF